MTTPAVSQQPPYRLQLHHIEACNCPHGCNCQFEGNPLPGFCEFLFGFQVIKGNVGKVTMDGVRFAMAAKYPKAIHEGNGHVVLFVDKSARPEQVDAIVTVLSGKAGGMPWEALAGTVTTLEGPIRETIEIKVDGNRSSCRIPGILELNQRPIVDVVSGENKEVHVVYPKGGFLWDDGNICTTATMKVNFGKLSFEYPGQYAATAIANWTNQ